MLLTDAESKVDLLNFSATANAVASMIRLSKDNPLSVGVFGDWGSGKSSLVSLIEDTLRKGTDGKDYLFVDFNAWLYQGFDDAKMALMQRVYDELENHVKENEGLLKKVQSLIKRINVLRGTKLVLSIAGSAAAGGLLSGPQGVFSGLTASMAKADIKGVLENSERGLAAGEKAIKDIQSCVGPEKGRSIPKEISELRELFGKILSEAKIRLVVLVDDLDRCLPDTAVSTLEAMRLLLFTNRTVFIVAADKEAIQNAVRIRYSLNNDSELVGNYVDKLVQIPVSVPHPSHNEIRCYLTALLAETAHLKGLISDAELLAGCNGMAGLLAKAWLGKVSTSDIDASFGAASSRIRGEIDLADQMVSVMATAEKLSGNPRNMKRFVNAAYIRRSIAESQKTDCPLDALLKLMLLETCAAGDQFAKIHREVFESDEGVSETIKKWESAQLAADPDECATLASELKWVIQWARLQPRLSDMDLRPLMYYSRDVATWNYSVADELSKVGCEILAALLKSDMVSQLIAKRIKEEVSPEEAILILRKMMANAKTRNWDAGILTSALTIPESIQDVQSEYIKYIDEYLPKECIPVSIIPYMAHWAAASEVLKSLAANDKVSKAVRNAINKNKKVGV